MIGNQHMLRCSRCFGEISEGNLHWSQVSKLDNRAVYTCGKHSWSSAARFVSSCCLLHVAQLYQFTHWWQRRCSAAREVLSDMHEEPSTEPSNKDISGMIDLGKPLHGLELARGMTRDRTESQQKSNESMLHGSTSLAKAKMVAALTHKKRDGTIGTLWRSCLSRRNALIKVIPTVLPTLQTLSYIRCHVQVLLRLVSLKHAHAHHLHLKKPPG